MKTVVMGLCLVTALSVYSQTPTGYTITGELEGMELASLLFSDGSGKKEGMKKVMVDKDGKFEINGSHKEDRVYIASLTNFNINSMNGSGGVGLSHGASVPLAIQNGDHIRITSKKDNFKWAKVTGNDDNKYLNKYRKLVKKNNLAIEDLNAEIEELVENNADENKINQKEEKMAALQKKTNQMVVDFIKQNP